jgi:hypothetical protein
MNVNRGNGATGAATDQARKQQTTASQTAR